MKLTKTLIAASLAGMSSLALAGSVTLDFEGAGDGNKILGLYSPTFSFNDTVRSRVDDNQGGTFGVRNVPSGKTVLELYGNDQTNEGEQVTLTINVANGFSSEFKLWYSTIQTGPGSIRLFDGLNGTGNEEGTFSLTDISGNTCISKPGDTGQFCNWAEVDLKFAGLAKSIQITGNANQYLFDSLFFGEVGGTQPPTNVPEPSSYALLGLAMLGMTAATRKARNKR